MNINKIIILIIFLCFFFFKYQLSKTNIDVYQKYIEMTFDNSFDAFNKSIKYIKNCLSPDFLKFNNISSLLLDKPKVSIVIPLYNCQNYILRAIKSIQYQNIQNIEILLVDDFSKDNTANIIIKIQSEDKRIKLLKNKKNMGTLYSRSIGVLSSKGKYLFTLDNDDLFLDKDILDTITKIGENGNFDIVEFKAISNLILNNDLLNNNIHESRYSHQKPIVLFQPELGRFPIPTGNKIGSYGIHDIYLWGKCIKTSIYQKALKKLGIERYSRFMICSEDLIVNYMLFNIAESFIFIPKYGIYHIYRFGSGHLIGDKIVSRYISSLYLIDVVIDFSRNYENNKKLAAYILINYLKNKNIRKVLNRNKYNLELIIFCVKRILKSEYISENLKNEIKMLTKNLKLGKKEKYDSFE